MVWRAHTCWVHVTLVTRTLGKQGPCSIVVAGNSWEVAFQGAIQCAARYTIICQWSLMESHLKWKTARAKQLLDESWSHIQLLRIPTSNTTGYSLSWLRTESGSCTFGSRNFLLIFQHFGWHDKHKPLGIEEITQSIPSYYS